jgi:hypothetical protein
VINDSPASIPKLLLAVATVVALVPPLAIGRVPVTPVVSGRPVAFVKVIADGVSRAGVVRDGLADNTTVLPVPVVVAAEIAVPLPANTGELIVVSIVMAGVVVDVATVPANPFVETTLTLVTVPDVEPGGAAHVPSARK